MFSPQKWEFLDCYIVKLYTSDQEGTVEELAHSWRIGTHPRNNCCGRYHNLPFLNLSNISTIDLQLVNQGKTIYLIEFNSIQVYFPFIYEKISVHLRDVL